MVSVDGSKTSARSTSSGGGSSSAIAGHRWIQGMLIAAVFTVVYLVAPIYIVTVLLSLIFRYPSLNVSLIYSAPVIISLLVNPISLPSLFQYLRPMLDYFDYEEIIESSPVDITEELRKDDEKSKNYIIAMQPHGVISYCGFCAAISSGGQVPPTAVASSLLSTPILKHVLGIFNLISASKKKIVDTLTKKKGMEGSVVIYVGGIAELFLVDENEERLYLSQRKGFIKLALTTPNVDVIPGYLFGNTTVLSVFKTDMLEALSRKMGVSMTYLWGKYYMPIPRDTKMLYALGQPLGMPYIDNPTQEDIDKWHDKYCKEVARLFDTHKERVPLYKHKKLVII